MNKLWPEDEGLRNTAQASNRRPLDRECARTASRSSASVPRRPHSRALLLSVAHVGVRFIDLVDALVGTSCGLHGGVEVLVGRDSETIWT